MPDNTSQKLDTRFKSGAEWNGNAAGRPKGARNRLADAFIAALLADWEAHGASAIEALRVLTPAEYLKLVVSALPKHPGINLPD